MWCLDRGSVFVRPTRHGDVVAIGDRLRKADVDEIWASTHLGPMEALVMSRKASPICQTVVRGKEPIAIFGCAPEPERPLVAGVWFLATDELSKIRHSFLRGSRECVQRMLKEYPLLYNWVDARNTESIRWLKWCGATLEDAKPFGPEGLPFHFFSIKRSEPCVSR